MSQNKCQGECEPVPPIPDQPNEEIVLDPLVEPTLLPITKRVNPNHKRESKKYKDATLHQKSR